MPHYIRLTPVNNTTSPIVMTIGKTYDIIETEYPGTFEPRYKFTDDEGNIWYQQIHDLSKDYILVSEYRDQKINQLIDLN